MEGVLVSAKKEGSNITTTVVTDDKGQYSFPADRLEPGKYTISIRAVGFVLDGPKAVEIPAGKDAKADIKLNKTRNVMTQLTNAEWLNSAPGTHQQKLFLNSCGSCHTLQRIFMSSHTADEWKQIFARMDGYANGSQPQRPQLLPAGARPNRDMVDPKVADYFATISMNSPDAQEFDIKTEPRPKGKATKVIITEYDVPRKEAMPHDVIVDANGNVWYSDFGSLYVGELDPKTGKVTDYALPALRKDRPTSTLDLEPDPNGNLWISMMYQRRRRQDRHQDQGGQRLSLSRRMGGTEHAHLDGVAELPPMSTARCGRTTRRRASNTGSISPPANGRIWAWPGPARQADQRLRHAGRQEQQRLHARIQRHQHRPAASQGQHRHHLADADRRLAAAPRPRRRAEPSVVRRICRQRHRACSTPKEAKIKEWVLPNKYDWPYDVVAGQERRGLDRLDVHRPGDAARHQERRDDPVSAAALDQHPARVRGRERPAQRCSGSAATTAPRSSRSSRRIEFATLSVTRRWPGLSRPSSLQLEHLSRPAEKCDHARNQCKKTTN